MKRIVAVVAVLTVLAVGAFAQNPAPSPAPNPNSTHQGQSGELRSWRRCRAGRIERLTL